MAVRWALQAAVWTLLAGWFGAFSFFALVIAPTAFQVLPSQAVAGALREEFRIDVDQRIEGAAAVGAHKTSMLQDIERGRRTEIDAIAGAGAELGRVTGVPTPRIDSLHAQVTALDG